jgi:shikimate dehydrogenase
MSYDEIDRSTIKRHELIINTTPLGMHPLVDTCPPIAYEHLTPSHTVIDLIYNPEITLFMQNARMQGASAFNGMLMLQKQAEKALEFFKQK